MHSRTWRLVGVFCLAMSTEINGAEAAIGPYASECVSDYSQYTADNGGLPTNLPNACVSMEGLDSVLASYGNVQHEVFENNLVYDTDTIQHTLGGDTWGHALNGQDDAMTDQADSSFYYFSGHGICGDGAIAPGPPYCQMDSQCLSGGVQGHCNSATNKCVWYCNPCGSPCPSGGSCAQAITGYNGAEPAICYFGFHRYHVTSSTQDHVETSFQPFNRHYVDDTTWARFGESPATAGFAGVGTTGNLDVAVFDSSCSSSPVVEALTLGPIFAGLHLYLGYQTWDTNSDAADVRDTPYRGHNFATRLMQGQAVGQAWHNTFVAEQGGPTNPPEGGYPYFGYGCASVTSCSSSASDASSRTTNEHWPPDRPDPTGAGYCSTYLSCNFSFIPWGSCE